MDQDSYTYGSKSRKCYEYTMYMYMACRGPTNCAMRRQSKHTRYLIVGFTEDAVHFHARLEFRAANKPDAFSVNVQMLSLLDQADYLNERI